MPVQSLGREDPLEEEMATHSNILTWRIPWSEEPGGIHSLGSQKVGHDQATEHTGQEAQIRCPRIVVGTLREQRVEEPMKGDKDGL